MKHAEYCEQFLKPGERVLDVGSGRGDFVCAMAARGFLAHGVEVSLSYIQATEERVKRCGVSVTVVQAPGEKTPFPENHFHFVNCAEVTEHVDNPLRVCAEIYRVLQPGGKCYISFHNRFGCYDYHYHLFGINWVPRAWTETILKLLGKNKSETTEIGKQKLISMHYYTYHDILKKLFAIGFKVQDIREQKMKSHFAQTAPTVMFFYKIILRPLYFNTFHLLLEKPFA